MGRKHLRGRSVVKKYLEVNCLKLLENLMQYSSSRAAPSLAAPQLRCPHPRKPSCAQPEALHGRAPRGETAPRARKPSPAASGRRVHERSPLLICTLCLNEDAFQPGPFHFLFLYTELSVPNNAMANVRTYGSEKSPHSEFTVQSPNPALKRNSKTKKKKNQTQKPGLMQTQAETGRNSSAVTVKHKETPRSERSSSHRSAPGKSDLPEARARSVFQTIHTSFHVVFSAIFCRKV